MTGDSDAQSAVEEQIQATLGEAFGLLAERIDERIRQLEALRTKVTWPSSVGPPKLREFSRVTHETYEAELKWLIALRDELLEAAQS